MPTLPLPLFTRSYKNADGEVLTDDAAVQYNGYLDDLEGLNIRPGEVLAIDTGYRNDGMFMWPDKNYIVCVDEGRVSLRYVVAKTLVDFANAGSITFKPGNLVSFASNGDQVCMAAGGKISVIDKYGVLQELVDPQAPTIVTHVAFLDGYILAITGQDGKFSWSDVSQVSDWSALSFATAEGSPDNTKSLFVIQRQIFLLGTVSTEIWENDGSSPFTRIPGGLIEVGCIAKHSPVRHDNSLIWLTDTRQFVKFTGTDVEFISSRYDKEIMKFSIVSDCIGGLVHKDGQEFCLFHFPSMQRTFAYSPNKDDWSEWGNWDSDAMAWLPYDFRATVRDLETGLTFVGKESALAIACLDSDSRVDITSGTTTRPFKFLRRTGHINLGTKKKKRIQEVRFTAKRGSSTNAGDPKLMFRYRNDGKSSWSNIKEISLGKIGDNEQIVRLSALGICRTRQYEISATDDAAIVFSDAEIDFTVLR